MISDNYIHTFEGSYQYNKVGKELNYDEWDFDEYKTLSERCKS